MASNGFSERFLVLFSFNRFHFSEKTKTLFANRTASDEHCELAVCKLSGKLFAGGSEALQSAINKQKTISHQKIEIHLFEPKMFGNRLRTDQTLSRRPSSENGKLFLAWKVREFW